MVETFESNSSFRVSIKSLGHDQDSRVVHAGVQALSGSIIRLSRLEQADFTFFPRSQRSAPRSGKAPANSAESPLYVGLQFEAPLDKFRVVLRCVGDWLDRTQQTNLFAVDIPPAHTLTLKTNQAKSLAQLLPLGEALLPPQTIYLAQAEAYVDTFGELTPAAKANLLLLRHRLDLSGGEANDLNARAMGPFKSLAEKYQHFRKELLACKHETTLDEDFWQVMRDKAFTMSLPETDAQFLKDERLRVLRTEADRARQQAEADAEAERQRYREQQQRLLNYRRAFEALVIDGLIPSIFECERASFRQHVMANLSSPEFNRGRLTQARDFYRLNQQEADALERAVLDELYLLSDLI